MTASFSITTIDSWRSCFDELLSGLVPGMTIALSGPLGAGKTTCVQGLVKYLGGEMQVKSPTFALLRTYRVTRSPFTRVLHIDAYRLEREADAQVLDLDEELEQPGTIACIEWPEQLPMWMLEHAERVVWLTIAPEGIDGTRHVTLEWRG